MIEEIFGAKNILNTISWRRTTTKNDYRYWRYNREKMHQLLQEGRIIQTKPGSVPQYKRYIDEVAGIAVGDTWDDVPPLNSQADERLGYPTQKPEAFWKG